MSLPPLSERGSALIGVLLLLMMMSALTAAFAVSGHTETLVVRNHQTAAQARAAAESGLNHAAEVVVPWIANWKINYPAAASVDVVLDTLLVSLEGNPGFLAGITVGEGVGTPVCGTCDVSYDILLFDEDSPDRVGWTTLGGVEDGNGQNDTNRTIVIQAIGYGPNGATARAEVIISPYKLPAIAVDGDIDLGLSEVVALGSNSNGGIHANGNLNVTGALAVVGLPLAKGTVSASGDLDATAIVATGTVSEGAERMDIPAVEADDFEAWADRILTSDGRITNAAGAVLATCAGPGNPCQLAYGVRYDSGDWAITTVAAANHTYYVQGAAEVSPVGTTVLTPMAVTIIAEGSINGTQGYIEPHAGDLLMVTDKDLTMAGNFNAGVPLSEGQILVGEQVSISGSAVVRGQLIVGDRTSTGVPHTSSLSGAVVVTNDYDVGSSLFRVAGWRGVR